MSGKSNTSNLLKQLSRTKSSGGSLSLFSGTPLSASGNLKPAKAATTGSGITSGKAAVGINFGKPPVQKPTSGTSTDWTKLLEQSASSGLASAFGGSFGLGSVAGIGSIISGIASLFGGSSKEPAPLNDFTLPASQNQMITVSANGNTPASNVASTVTLQDHSTQIAQAVKTALLHSSSLNDVISEI